VTGYSSKKVDCSNLKPGFCQMGIDLDGSDGWAEIRYVGWFQDGAQIWLPSGATFQYRAANANKQVVTAYDSKNVDCSNLKPGFCLMPIDLDGSDGWVEIRYVDWFQDGETIWLPSGAAFQYRAANENKKVVTGYGTKSVDCSALAPGFCHMGILINDPYEDVEIRYVGWFEDGDQVWMPTGATLQYRARDAEGQCTGYISKPVDCSDLVHPPQPL
jgi:hypothetical protein